MQRDYHSPGLGNEAGGGGILTSNLGLRNSVFPGLTCSDLSAPLLALSPGGCAAGNEDGGWRIEDGKARRRRDSCVRTTNLAWNVRVFNVRLPGVASHRKPPT